MTAETGTGVPGAAAVKLQWSRRRVTAETAGSSPASTAFLTLQWSRRRVTAETPVAGGGLGWDGRASMEPPSGDGGDGTA